MPPASPLIRKHGPATRGKERPLKKVLKKYGEFMGRRVGLGDILWRLDKTFAIIGPLAALLRALVLLLEH